MIFSTFSKRFLAINVFFVLGSFTSYSWGGAYDDFIYAVKFNDEKRVAQLLQRGIDPNSTEVERGETALMIALRENSMRVFNTLLHHPEIKLEAGAANGDTALMLASYLANFDAVKNLISAGAKVHRSGWTALHYAAAAGQPEIIAYLLDHEAQIDAISPNRTTPLMMAVSSGRNKAVSVLIERGANLEARNDAGMTAYDFAMHYEQKSIAQDLAKRLALSKP